MAKRSRLFLCGSIGLALTGAVASAEAAPNPFDTFEQMIEQSFRQPMRGHSPKYRAHKPVLVKATPEEPPAAPPPGPAAILSPDVPAAVLPLPAARPAEAPSAAMPLLPPRRPPVAEGDAAAAPSTPGKSAPEKPATKLAALTPPTEAIEEKPAATFSALAALGVKSIPLAPIEEGKCTVLDPVSVASLESGAVSLTSKAILNDNMAETFATWVHNDVMPAAHDVLKGELTGIRVIGSYTCRSRDNIAGGKLSEHGFADAIDVAGFRVDKRWIEVGGDRKDQADDERFLDEVRHAACHRFTTVLGPGSDSYHSNHFHLDLERRGKSGKVTLCE